MKKSLLFCLAITPGFVTASDYAPGFAVSGNILGTTYTAMDLDITVHRRYMAANGAIHDPAGLSTPLTGTCQITTSGGAWCILQLAHFSLVLDLGPNLNGVMRALDGNGNTVSSLAVTFTGME